MLTWIISKYWRLNRKKIIAITITIAKPAIEKLLIIPTNIVLKGKGQDGQNISMKQI